MILLVILIETFILVLLDNIIIFKLEWENQSYLFWLLVLINWIVLIPINITLNVLGII